MNNWLFLLKALLGFAKHIPINRELPVLVIDGDSEAAEQIAYYVKEAGADPITVSTLEGARDLLLTRKFRMILMDVEFPSGSGIEFARHYLMSKRGKLPLVFITGRIDRLESLPPGRCWSFISKGTEDGSLLEAIRDALAAANGINGQVPLGGIFIIVWTLTLIALFLGFFWRELSNLITHLNINL